MECPRQAAINMLQTDENLIEEIENVTSEDEGNFTQNICVYNHNNHQVTNCSDIQDNTKCFNISAVQNMEDIEAFIFTLDSRIRNFRKEVSPTLNCVINDTNVLCIVDEGSEINCCSYLFAQKAKIPIVEVKCSAVGANKSKMNVVGMAKADIYASVIGSRNLSQIKIVEMIVINNLGADVLLGQPTKVDNQIITFPHMSQIQFTGTDERMNKIHYPLRKDDNLNINDVVRVNKPQTIFPQESFGYKLPNKFALQKKICITERPNTSPWIGSQILDVKNGVVDIINKADYPVHLYKYQHIADVSNVRHIKTSVNTNIRQVPVEEKSLEHLEPYSDWNYNENFVDDVKIDPDNRMNAEWKQKFRELCQEYSDIINYRPAKYNGFYGDVDNTIEFASIPPPTNKIHMPKYNEQKNLILAEKMDQLERWHVLAKPETLGVKPKFVCPSLLVPKDDTNDTVTNEWRLITNFTPLNKYIKKPPTAAPTIQETKMQLAKFRYIATLDLANFYYQHGVTRSDMAYLATHHPYKGLLVYTCEPQGLRGVSEHSYERLGRVYGELCQQNKMARQADGLFVGGNSLQQLYDNLTEVFERTRNCGFTLKPSKVIINPKTVILFGWIREDGAWRPTEHTLTPLAKADMPMTVRQLRGFLGAFKQLSPCIKNYAVILTPLEKIAAGRGSSEPITWTEELIATFENVKQALNSIETYHTPSPDDVIHTFSDWSQLHGAVGGRMEIHRKQEDGTIEKLHGGFFSARVSQWQSRWLPCEGESLAAKAVIQHFKPQLQNSNNTIYHHTDSLPTCQAWNKSKTGAFSTSARISAFLTEISTIDIEFIHTPGRDMTYSDFASRNANTCDNEKCQICQYLNDLVFTADNIVRSIAVEDIENGNTAMPFIQQNAWIQSQKHDKTLQHLVKLIEMGQIPEKKKTCNEFTTLKLLYNLYCKGSLHVSKQGLITVTQKQENGEHTKAIVVPTNLYPGLAHSVHLKTSHSSKTQLTRLMTRYFYSVGHHRMIADVIDNCHVCLSLKQLPKELFPETTGEITGFGTHFACDVMVRNKQNILLIREKLTQFTQAKVLLRETANDILEAIIVLIADKIPECGTIIRTDNATPFQKLNALTNDERSWLNKFNIKIELGDTFNHNRNPVAENVVKECHKEINKAGFVNEQLNELQLTQIMKTMNSRIRNRGLSAKEMCFMRDLGTNKNIIQQDEKLKEEQRQLREHNHNKEKTISVEYETGDTVMIKDQLTKTKPREKFIVIARNTEHSKVKVQKQDNKFFARQYDVPKHQLIKAPRKAAMRARELISNTADVNHIQTLHDIPTHAYDDSLDTDDEMDMIFYTYMNEDMVDTLDSSWDETEDTSSTSTEYRTSHGEDHNLDDTLMEEDRTQYVYDPFLITTEMNMPRYDLTRTQQIDKILEETSEFLRVHPRPPTYTTEQPRLRRSERTRVLRDRYGN